VNFDGPVRVAGTVGSGTATVTLAFPAWGEAFVGSTTHALTVLPPKPGPKPEPVAPSLIGSLVHPDRKVGIPDLKFSPDGTRLFAAGYPSGVVQIWDVADRREIRRIDTPPGYRGSFHYALLTPDWKTLYVPVERRTSKTIEKGGKSITRFEYSGEVRVWDLTTGKEQDSLRPTDGSAPVHAGLSPDGRHLVCVEAPSYDTDHRLKETTWAWDLTTGARRKLDEGYTTPTFSPDGKRVAYTTHDWDANTHTLKLVELASGKELARFPGPDKDQFLWNGEFSPDGAVLAAHLNVLKKGPRPEVRLLDGKTLAERGRFVAEPDADGLGNVSGRFSPDGKVYVISDRAGKAHVWDLAAGKVVRSFEVGSQSWALAFSPDGKTLAVGWAPAGDPDEERVHDPDPRDYPQPRVTLFDLAGSAPPRVLVAPHGYVGGVAFSPDGKTLAFGSAGAVHLFDLTR
jgi:WD40 repeat protein